MLFCKDISASFRIEKLNQEKQAAIISDQAKSVFLANISHELRTPMHGILSYASMGISRINKVPITKLLTYFNNIHLSGNRLLLLLNDLLDLSKLEAGQMEMNFKNINIIPVIERALDEQLSKVEDKNINLTFDKSLDGIDKEINIDLSKEIVTGRSFGAHVPGECFDLYVVLHTITKKPLRDSDQEGSND